MPSYEGERHSADLGGGREPLRQEISYQEAHSNVISRGGKEQGSTHLSRKCLLFEKRMSPFYSPLISVFCGLRPHHQPLLELGLEVLPGVDVLRHPRLDPERPVQDLDLACTSWDGKPIRVTFGRHFPLHDSEGSCLSIEDELATTTPWKLGTHSVK